jgi:hypothetical protein
MHCAGRSTCNHGTVALAAASWRHTHHAPCGWCPCELCGMALWHSLHTHLGIGVDWFVGPFSVIRVHVIVRLAHEGGHAVKGDRPLEGEGCS